MTLPIKSLEHTPLKLKPINNVIEAFKNLSLRNKLLLTYLIIAIVPIIFIGTVSYIKSSRIIIKQAQDSTSLAVEQIDAYISKFERLTYTACSNIVHQRILETNHQDPFAEKLDNREKINQYMYKLIKKMIEAGEKEPRVI